MSASTKRISELATIAPCGEVLEGTGKRGKVWNWLPSRQSYALNPNDLCDNTDTIPYSVPQHFQDAIAPFRTAATVIPGDGDLNSSVHDVRAVLHSPSCSGRTRAYQIPNGDNSRARADLLAPAATRSGSLGPAQPKWLTSGHDTFPFSCYATLDRPVRDPGRTARCATPI
jgi:hypothetical protein